jgi:predicted dehydrogenase
MFQVAVIGTGYIGAVHLETLLRVPGVRLKALVDSKLELGRQLADKYGIPTVFQDYRALLDDPDIQVVHNCTPNHLHFEINQALLEAGKHVMSEKPLALDSGQARALRDLAADKGRLTGINFCYRYYPAVQEAAARVRSGAVGKVYSVFGAYFQDWLLYETDYNWRLDKQVSGASNTIADIGSHWFDLAQFVAGLKIVEVMADLRTILPVRKKSTSVLSFARQSAADVQDVPVEVDDYGAVLLRFENGAAGAFMASQLCAGRKCTIDLQVYGSQAAFAWNHENPSRLWIGRREQANELFIENPLQQQPSTARFARLPSGHPMGYFDTMYNLFADFYQAIRLKEAGQAPGYTWPDFQDGFEEMAIVEAVLKSHAEGRWVRVER